MAGLLDWVDPAREWWKSRPEVIKGLLSGAYSMATDQATREAAMARLPKPFDRSVTGEQMMNNALNAGPSGLLGKIVYHGSPHKFDKFDASKIGTGEGAQAYGHGVYLADSPGVAGEYQQRLSHIQGQESKIAGKPITEYYNSVYDRANKLPAQAARPEYDKAAMLESLMMHQTPQEILAHAAENQYHPAAVSWFKKEVAKKFEPAGNMYMADLPDEWIPKMLDWDKPLAEQSPEVRAALQKLGEMMPDSKLRKGSGAMGLAESRLGSKAAAAQALREAGIPGIRYLDGGSRSAGQGSYNYVVFPGLEDQVKILERNGIPLSGLLGR